MGYERNVVVNKMKSWIGKKESDGSHKSIIDIYNSISPLPVGYKVTYTDAWCAAAVSAAFHAVGYDAIFPAECGCGRMITKAQNMGIWQEDDGYIPSPGDCVLYDWDDSGSGDNKGSPDHVGLVESVVTNTITVIEGNYSDSVKRRSLKVNGRYIRGFITPKFNESSSSSGTTVSGDFAVGDIVEFTGTQHYASAGATTAKSCKPGTAEITQIYKPESSKHPYHLVRTEGSESTVYGWVDANTFTKTKEETKQETKEETKTKQETKDTSNAKQIWDFLMTKINNPAGVAGLMGNLYAESAYEPTNLQNSYEKSLGYTDASYTSAVDSGKYTNFVHDSAGYGLAQWTYYTRKQNLLTLAQKSKVSIGNLEMQLEFLISELSSYGLLSKLKKATTIREASDLILKKFECPADQGEAVQIRRAGYGQTVYDKYAGNATKAEEPKIAETIDTTATVTKEVVARNYAESFNKSKAGVYMTTANLHLRDGASVLQTSLLVIPKGTKVRNYGYFTKDWLYIQLTYNGVKYVGFSRSDYLTRI